MRGRCFLKRHVSDVRAWLRGYPGNRNAASGFQVRFARALCRVARVACGLIVACGVFAADSDDRLANHPLTGRVWDVPGARFIDAPALKDRLARSHFVLLGETHDNPDHHRIQLELVSAMIAASKRPALGFEQFDREHQAAIERARNERPGDAEHLRESARFNAKGWNWAFYEPLVTLALRNQLPVLAANLSRSHAFGIAMHGLATLGNADLPALGLDQPLPALARTRLEQVLDESHCHKLPAAQLPGMVDAQRARDAIMASTIALQGERGAVLIAGSGHARRDFGVPLYLTRRFPGAVIVSVGLIEVDAQALLPEDYLEMRAGSAMQPYDYLWFTPRTLREDPCGKFQMRAELR